MSAETPIESVATATTVERPPVSRLAIGAAALGALAIVALIVYGAVGIAVFAVGVGHIALHRTQTDAARGRSLALAGLAAGYLVAVVAIVETVAFGVQFLLTQH